MNMYTSETEAVAAVRNFLAGIDMAGRAVDADEDLLTGGTLDSLKIMNLVAYVEKSTGSKVEAMDVLPQNFGSARKVAHFMTSQAVVSHG